MKDCPHRNLVRVLDYDKSEDGPRWFVMDYFPKGTLKEGSSRYLGRPIAALRAMLPVMDAAGVLHDQRYVHRDIKPNNIFGASDGRWVLGDLGIVFTGTEARLTLPEDSVFSPHWIPDWVVGLDPDEYTERVDVFMIAKVLHYLITGKNIRASQFNRSDVDMRDRFPRAHGIVEVLGFLRNCIVTEEAECVFRDATEMALAARGMIAAYRGPGRVQRLSDRIGRAWRGIFGTSGTDGLIIQRAEYGAEGKVVDVSNYLRDRIVNDRLEETVGNHIAGDPIVGTPKKLTVWFTFRGERKISIVDEGKVVTLP